MDEGMRCWYDIPFTVAESLLADEDVVISVGPTTSGTALPRIDSLEVYGRAKDEFGWKEKMDAVLDMEARVLGHGLLLPGSSKKRALTRSASIEEQVIADGLKLLSIYYSVCRPRQEVELSELKCKQLLETIFESDTEILLQTAACRVLQSIFPKKEIYYQVMLLPNSALHVQLCRYALYMAVVFDIDLSVGIGQRHHATSRSGQGHLYSLFKVGHFWYWRIDC